MSDATSLFNSAELALAAYSDLQTGGTSNDANKVALAASAGAGMSLTQIIEFAKRYPTVVTQFRDTLAEGGMGTSFSATVFADATGNLTVAFRGTLEWTGTPSDLSTDADILTAGAGYDQIVAMANWWARASAPAGQLVQQYQLVQVAPWAVPADAVVLRSDTEWAYVLESAPSATGSGEFAGMQVNVTGHSLGGHLAMAFATLFPGSVNQVTTFDAPGFIDNATNQAFFAKLGGSVPNSSSFINVAADEARVGEAPFYAISRLHSQPGVLIDIPIQAIHALRDTDAYATRVGTLQILPTVADEPTLRTLTQGSGAESMAWRYVLRELNPFVVLDAPDGTLYSRFQSGGANADELDDYDAANNRQGLTRNYIEDRAAFLERKLYLATYNLDKNYQTPEQISDPNAIPDARASSYQMEGRYYEDRTSGFVASSGGSAEVLTQYVFGTERSDTIVGGNRDDHLYGGKGADLLEGGAGNNWIEGGQGDGARTPVELLAGSSMFSFGGGISHVR